MASVPIQKQQTYITGFDLISRGGLPSESTTLLAGTPGSGKTVFAAQLLAAGITYGQQNGVFVTFEEKPSQLRRHLLGFGWDVERWEKEGRWAFVDASPRGDEPPVPETGPFDFGGLITRVEHAVQKVNARRVCFDSISTVFGRFRNQAIIRFELFRLSEWLREKHLMTLFSAERHHEDTEVTQFSFEDFVADNVLILRNRMEGLSRRRTVEILKMRGAPHQKGEFPFTITSTESTNPAIVIIPVTEMVMTQPSSNERVSSGVPELDEMCGGGLFRDSIVLVTGATGCGKTLLTTEFVKGASQRQEKSLLYGFEESHDQLCRNARGWGTDYLDLEQKGLLHVVCTYPETLSLEDHLTRIKEYALRFQPRQIVLDSLSALERISSPRGFREFVVALTCFIKEHEITGMFTLASPSLMGGATVTESHISSVADSIVLLRYIELAGSMRRGVTVLKMRGSQHAKEIREFSIDGTGMHIGKGFRHIAGILSGQPQQFDQAFYDRLDELM